LPQLMEFYGGKVIYDCHPRLENMMQRSLPGLTVYPTRKIIDKPLDWVADEKPHFKVPLGNLPSFFIKEEADFPKVPYLLSRKDLVEEYKEWLELAGPGPYIGIAFIGGHKRTRKDLRSLFLDQWGPIFKAMPNATYISLQYTDHMDLIRSAAEEFGVTVHHWPEVVESARWERYEVVRDDGKVVGSYQEKDHAKSVKSTMPGAKIVHYTGPGFDYDETLALAEAIRQKHGSIVSVNTTLVHLCGAAGIPVHVLTPHKCAWRYGLTREDMVWYLPGLILQYRQTEDLDWGPALDVVADRLKQRYTQKIKKAKTGKLPC
nr:hypothetical protein [Anaerolineae bacterium]